MQLLLVGDVMLGRLVNQALRQRPADYPWGDTLPLFRRADLSICNLECVISDRGRPWSRSAKAFHFRSDSKNLAVLQSARIGMVSLANNHVLDYEEVALEEMIGLLDAHGIAFSGAGRDREQARSPAVWQGGMRVGLLAFSDNEPGWEAAPGRPGIFYAPSSLDSEQCRALLAGVAALKPQVDILVVSAHWGPNWGRRPPALQQPVARALIDAGADIIFGHSGHVFRGIELYRQRPVIYCAGDFIDDYAVDVVERNDESFIYSVDLQPGRIERLRLYPTTIDDFQARLASGDRQRRIAAKMQELCAELGTTALWREGEAYLEIDLG